MRLVDADAVLKNLGMNTEDCNKCKMSCCTEFTRQDFCEAVHDAPTVGGWISVKDRLPGTGRLALVYGSAGGMTIARYIANNEWLVPGIFSTVTHWMPLPEPPKEEADEHND